MKTVAVSALLLLSLLLVGPIHAGAVEPFAAVGSATLGSLSLNGAPSYAEAPAAPELNLTGDWTVETWFKESDPRGFNHENRELLMKGDHNTSGEAPYYILIGNNHILAGVRTGGVDYPMTWNLEYAGLHPGAWHHVAVTFRADLNVLNLWLDGKHIRYMLVPAHSVGNDLPLQIGRSGRTSGKNWVGQLHDLRIWNIARRGTDISATYLTEVSQPANGLVANWKFDETSGQTALDSVAGLNANLGGGASFKPVKPGCGLGDGACPNLTVAQFGLPDVIEAAPDRQLTLKVVVENANDALTGPANIPAGARILQETLPTIMSDSADPNDVDAWNGGGAGPLRCFLSCKIHTAGHPSNTVEYVDFNAPSGYQCATPSAGITTPGCTATAADVLQPGDKRVFTFTISLFDIKRPYLSVSADAVRNSQLLTLPISTVSLVNPDGAVTVFDSSNNSAVGTAAIHAPFIDAIEPKGNTCQLSSGFGGSISVPQVTSSLVSGTHPWTCSLEITTAKSSAPVRFPGGALTLAIESGSIGRDTAGIVVESSCAVKTLPDNVSAAGFSCSTRQVGGDGSCTTDHCVGALNAVCSSSAGALIPAGAILACELTAKASAPAPPIFLGRDVAPLIVSIDPEVIRFASPRMLVWQRFDLLGGSVDFD